MFRKYKIITNKKNKLSDFDAKSIIDLRSSSARQLEGQVKGSLHANSQQLIANPQNFLNKEKEYYLLCSNGHEAKTVAKELVKKDYKIGIFKKGFNSFNY